MGPKLIVIIIVAVCGSAYFIHSSQQKLLAEKAKLNFERSVDVLSPGTEDAWISYVERRVAAVMQFKVGAISINNSISEATYVSRNTPYRVSCDPITGGTVEFGYGENPVMVSIYGLVVDGEAEAAPPLGVSSSSVAAAKLSRRLCERIVILVSKIAQP
jgi:hypothetical protein